MATTALATSPLLRGYQEQLEAVRADAARLTGGMTDAQWAWRPEPGKWSAAQIVQHLNAIGRSYTDPLGSLLAQSRAKGSADRGDWRPTLTGRLMVWSMEPPPRVKLPAPPGYRPAEDAPAPDREAELARWRELHDEMERLIHEAAGLDLRRIRFVSPLSSLVRMNAGDALALLLAHERRHLWQMRRLREHPGFPAA